MSVDAPPPGDAAALPVPPGGSDEPHHPERPSLLKRLMWPLAGLAFVAWKLGKWAFIIIKGSKFLTTSLTMVVSIWAYALAFGLPWALGFVLLMFVHEMGHAMQMRREGIAASAPV